MNMTNEAVGKHAPAPFTAEELRILRARHTVARLMEGGDTVMALLNHIDWLAEKFSREENEHAELQSRCFEGFPSVSDGIFDAYKAARNSHAALSARCEKLEAALRAITPVAERGIDMGGGIGFLHPAIKNARALLSEAAK